MERFAYYFAWLNLIVTSIAWPILKFSNKTEPPIVLALSFYAIWQGSVIFISTAHVDKKQADGR
jgi:hypothetical protein